MTYFSELRPGRGKVESSLVVLARFLRFANSTIEQYGKVDGITKAEVVCAINKLTALTDVVDVLNESLPSGVNG